MKMLPEHYKHLKAAIDKQIELDPAMYENYMSRGLTHTRYNWDLLWRAKMGPFVCSTLYTYLKDSHIDTALRKITGKN